MDIYSILCANERSWLDLCSDKFIFGVCHLGKGQRSWLHIHDFTPGEYSRVQWGAETSTGAGFQGYVRGVAWTDCHIRRRSKPSGQGGKVLIF